MNYQHTVSFYGNLGEVNRGSRRLNYVDMLRKYTGLLEKQDIRTSVLDRDGWRE